MISITQVEDAVVSYLESVLPVSVTVIIANQPDLTFLPPAAVINVFNSAVVGWEDRSNVDIGTQDTDETIEALTTFSVSINLYGPGSHENAKNARMRLGLESSNFDFHKAGLGLISRSQVNNLSALVDGAMESRHQFDIVLNGVDSFTATGPAVLSATISGAAYNQDVNIPVEIEVT